VLVLGEDLGKAVGLLNQVLHRCVTLHQPKALLGLQAGKAGRTTGKGDRTGKQERDASARGGAQCECAAQLQAHAQPTA
jgi:hypothetical protein